MRRFISLAAFAFTALLASGCGNASDADESRIYASIYESVIAEMQPVLEERFPDAEIVWYQKGSEQVAEKVNSEIAAGGARADLIMTSDPFWYLELKRAGHLMPYDSPAAERVPENLKDPDNAFVTVRMPVMVMTVNENVPEAERPTSFQDLTDPKWKGRITMGNPLESGSNFTSVAALSDKYGWEYFEQLKANDAISAGGNSAVLNRVATGEKDVGIILLENLLKAHEENPDHPAQIIYPEDGVILVPSPIAIMANSANPERARAIYDFMLSDEGQQAIVDGYMYSPIDGIAPPAGARPWEEVRQNVLVEWSPEYLERTADRREEIKSRFSEIMFGV